MTPRVASFLAPIGHYEAEAEALLSAFRTGDEPAAWKIRWNHPSFRDRPVSAILAADLTLDDARTVVARLQHFDDWKSLEAFTGLVRTDPRVAAFEEAVEAVVAGDLGSLKRLLDSNPQLIHARSSRSHHATLLHYIAANGVENHRQKTPPNAAEVATLLLDRGAEVDALADMYDQKCTTMSMLVSSCHPAVAGLQVALAELLVDHGANAISAGTKWRASLMTALQFGYLDTARALNRRGAPVDSLAAAAGLGLLEESRRLLSDADDDDRHAALALSAQHGHVEVVELLLDAGEDPNRFNPEGFHSHSTPLHQAALAGHLAVVRLLVERGARLDIRDKSFDGTPLGWARHGGHKEVAEYLRQAAASADH